MSLYAGKKFLCIHGQTPKHSEVAKLFVSGGAEIEELTHETFLNGKIVSKVDFIVLDTISEKEKSIQILNELRRNNAYKTTPILALVEDSNEKIQSVLTLGASDYFLESEPPEIVETKAQILLGHPNNFAGSKIIHIPNDRKEVSSDDVKVLLVEDDPFLKALLSERIEKAGIELSVCSDGSTVMQKVKEFSPSVIILDLMLPKMNGLEILEVLRKDAKGKNIPVIIFSNKDSIEEKNRAKELGANKFFVKVKTDLSELIAAIDELA